ncbi:acyl dehydratase, partial [Streptomyces sp. SID10244]|nr:acyl dehydratase [Streptomyces sp. SID10244]
TSQRDEVTCPATATVSLPSREAGLATLRTPPAELEAIAAQMIKRHGELRAAKRTGQV